MDIEGTSHHPYEGENDDYNNSYEYYESEQYDDEYRPSSSSNYNLDHSDSCDSYIHETTWSGGHDSSDLRDIDTDIVSTPDSYGRTSSEYCDQSHHHARRRSRSRERRRSRTCEKRVRDDYFVESRRSRSQEKRYSGYDYRDGGWRMSRSRSHERRGSGDRRDSVEYHGEMRGGGSRSRNRYENLDSYICHRSRSRDCYDYRDDRRRMYSGYDYKHGGWRRSRSRSQEGWW